jgi:hypothetical protein
MNQLVICCILSTPTFRHPKLHHYTIPRAPEFHVQIIRICSKANTVYNHGWNPLVNLQLVHFVSIIEAAITEIHEARDSAFALQSPTNIQLMLSFSHINIIIYRSERNFILELFSITQSWYTINKT